MKKLFLVDAYALIYRMYYAFLNRPMRNAAGMNTSAIFGFVKFINEIIKKEQPHYFGVAFDTRGDTFRHELYTEYKANRDAAPEDIHASVPYIKDIMCAMRIPCVEKQGWEADDLIGTLSCKASNEGFQVYMVTPDKDFGQLVTPSCFIYKQRKNGEGMEVVGCDRIREVYGVDDPRLIVDILALWGDASDNIPGVPGIGEKTAIKLVNQYGTVENLLANIDRLSGKQKESIVINRDQLLLSKELARIDTEAPIEFDPKDFELEEPDYQALITIYRELGFSSFIKELGQRVPAAQEVSAETFEQGSLFGQAAPVEFKGAPQKKVNETMPDLFSEGFSTIDTTDCQYTVITKPEELEPAVKMLAQSRNIALEVVTSGKDPYTGSIVGIAFSVRPGEAWYIHFDEKNAARYLEMIAPVLENENINKTGHNLKPAVMYLRTAGISLRGTKSDTMILHYLVDPESRHGIEYIARNYLNYAPIERETLTGRGVREIGMDKVPVHQCGPYAAEIADTALRLGEVLSHKVNDLELEDLYHKIEEPLIDVLAEMELAGVRIDMNILGQSGERLHAQLDEIERQVREITGEPELNVNSSKQLGEVLFGKMKLDPKPKLTKTKQYRTDEEYLQSLSEGNPVIALVLEYRGIRKLLSTYIEALPGLVNPITGKVHTSYNQAVTATGRISSTNPNLQNIPVRDDQGREIRKAFVPQSADNLILSADYSQVELRIMAHLSGDENLLDAFRKGEDVHTATAARIFSVDLTDVTADQRRKAKTANFGIIYGISAFGLSQRLNIPRSEAKEIIENYFASYPDVKRYMDEAIAGARERGYVSTIFGRKRWLPDIRSANAVARGLAERNAINAPIQGSAADILKRAMRVIRDEFARLKLNSKVIMQVHDELVVDMNRSELEIVAQIVTQAMENAAELKIPLTVDYGVGDDWLAAH